MKELKLFEIKFDNIYIKFPDNDLEAIALVRHALEWLENRIKESGN